MPISNLSDKENKDLFILIQQLLQDIHVHYAPDHSVYGMVWYHFI